MRATNTNVGSTARSDAPPLQLLARGPIGDLTPEVEAALLNPTQADDADTASQVRSMIADVRSRGDKALMEMASRFDGVELGDLDAIEVPLATCVAALDRLDGGIRSALERAAQNIRRFHTAQLPAAVTVDIEPGVRITRAWTPLARVGVYAPGGTAAYPSSVLMGAVPARAAGVDEVILCSPPGPGGIPPDAVLAAAVIAGVDQVFAIGGAGAVAAMAFGTQSVPKTDAVVGPGNRWVTEAKRQLAGLLVIDSPAGPSEVLVLADDSADPERAALEMLAQAEHDTDARCVLISTSESLARATCAALERLLNEAPRRDIAAASFRQAGAVLTADSMDDAVRFTERFAPEHLSIMTADALALSGRIRNAGTIFVGGDASVAFGDYLTGANHVLPTAGRARSFSGLSTQHFLRAFTIQEIDAAGARSLAPDVIQLALAEGLPAHAAAASARAEGAAAQAGGTES